MILEVQYTQSVSVDVEPLCEELGIKPEDIKYIFVKWNTLYLTTEEEGKLEYELNYDLSGDLKHPSAVILRNEDFGCINDDLQHCDNPFAVEPQNPG
jgi:hypothetical protein